MNNHFTWNNHATSAIIFICVTLSAWIFKQSSILNWYALGAVLEVLYMLPADSWRAKNNTYDYHERDEIKTKYPKSSTNMDSDNRYNR